MRQIARQFNQLILKISIVPITIDSARTIFSDMQVANAVSEIIQSLNQLNFKIDLLYFGLLKLRWELQSLPLQFGS